MLCAWRAPRTGISPPTARRSARAVSRRSRTRAGRAGYPRRRPWMSTRRAAPRRTRGPPDRDDRVVLAVQDEKRWRVRSYARDRRSRRRRSACARRTFSLPRTSPRCDDSAALPSVDTQSSRVDRRCRYDRSLASWTRLPLRIVGGIRLTRKVTTHNHRSSRRTGSPPIGDVLLDTRSTRWYVDDVVGPGVPRLTR